MGVNLIDPNEEIRKYVGGAAGLPFPNSNNTGSVTTPPEDLVPYANLRVTLPGRSVIVDDVADQVQKQAEIGFIVESKLPPENKGKQGTSWSEIGGLSGFMKDSDGQYTIDGLGNLQREGTWGETFGITDISVKLNASFEPQVFISFVDIRGASLMEPGLNSPYAAFFHMPYPLFTLDLKGYYGRGISYKLHLMKFNSKFDAETGNFLINCEFIGFTFTYLADLMAIYSDVGPDLYGQYVTSDPDYFKSFNSIGDTAKKPWPEGSMTLGPYMNNIADMAAKMEAIENDENTKAVKDMTQTVSILKDVIAYWKMIVVSNLRPNDTNDIYTYDPHNETLTVTECLSASTKTLRQHMSPAFMIEVKKKRAKNANGYYLDLLLYIRGYTSNTGGDPQAEKNLASRASGAYRPYVTSVFAEMPASSKQLLNENDESKLPEIDQIKALYSGPVQWDHDADANTADSYGDDASNNSATLNNDMDSSTATDATSAEGCAVADAKEFLDQAKKCLSRAEMLLGELTEKKIKEEQDVRLRALVMPPTLENIFKLILNGVDGFNHTLTNVGKMANEQHRNDTTLRSKLRQAGTGTDIKDSEKQVFPFPLVYKTMNDGAESFAQTQSQIRTVKIFPGHQTGGGEYTYLDYTTDPYKWPEITFVERLIKTLIEKTRQINSTFSERGDSFTDEGGYAPAIVEETPPSGNPYGKLTSVERQIIPLVMLRTMLRLGNANYINCSGKKNLNKVWSEFNYNTSNVNKISTLEDISSTAGQEFIFALGKMEGETLIEGIEDDGANTRLNKLFMKLTGNSVAQQNPSSSLARNTAWTLYKDAGYDARGSSVSCENSNGKKTTTDCKFMVTNFGNNTPVIQSQSTGKVTAGTNSYYGCNYMNKSGSQIENMYGYYLPNVDVELNGNVNYNPCTTPQTNTSATVCPDFFISASQHVENVITPTTESGRLAKEELSGAVEKYYGQNPNVFQGSPKDYMQFPGGKAPTKLVNPKYILGPMGTTDYNWKEWIGWDFYSYYDTIKADQLITEGENNSTADSETLNTFISPDQFSPFGVLYTDSKKHEVGQTAMGKKIPFTDSQTFILEDALWMRNDIDNKLYGLDSGTLQSYTKRVGGESGNVAYPENINSESRFYSKGADTNGYDKTLKGDGSGVADARKTSDIALAYLYINNCGKYFSLSYMQDSSLGSRWDRHNIGKLFQTVGGYIKLPQYVLLTLGSLLYRHDQVNDIIDWPNYFNSNGVGAIDNSGYFWGENAVMYQIPRKDERPMTEPFFHLGQFTRNYRRSGEKFGTGAWYVPSDHNNRLHFVAGGWNNQGGHDLNATNSTTSAIQVADDKFGPRGFGWGSAQLLYEGYAVDQNLDKAASTTSGAGNSWGTKGININKDSDGTRRIYEKLPPWLLNAPEYIRTELKESFIAWATGESADVGHFNFSPSFPSLKSRMVETTTLPDLKADSGNTQKCESPLATTWAPYTLNRDPDSRLYTSFCSSIHETTNSTPANVQINRGICTMYNDSWGNNEANGGPWSAGLASDYAINFAAREMETENVHTVNGTRRILALNFQNRFTNIIDRNNRYSRVNRNSADVSNFMGRGVTEAEYTYTLPLLWNGWTNMRWQSSGEKPNTYPKKGFFNKMVKKGLSSYDDLQSYANSKWTGLQKQVYETYGSANTYYYIRKASHSNDIKVPNGYNRYASTTFHGDTDVNIRNNAQQGFNDVGNEVYKNIHYQIATSNYYYTIEGEDGNWANSWTFYDNPLSLTTEEGAGKGEQAGLGLSEPPNFYTPPVFYEATASNDNPSLINNELYSDIKDFMIQQVRIKNPSWRYWLNQIGDKNKTEPIKNNTVWTTTSVADRFFGGFLLAISEYLKLRVESGKQQDARVKTADILNDNDIKLDTYLTVKNIHDKWLCEPQQTSRNNLAAGTSKEAGKIGWLFDQFSFVDRAYNDIRHKFIDPSPLLNLKKNPKISLYTLIYDLITHNNFEFFPLPSNIEFSPESFRESFIPFLTVNEDEMNKNPRFYIMYMGGFSDSLDVDSTDYQYSNDGFDIDDECIDCPDDYFGEEINKNYGDSLKYGELLSDGKMKCESGECGAGDIRNAPQLVPQTGHWVCWSEDATGGTCKIRTQNVTAFRVAFGQDNQNFFKSVSLDQAEFQETQESLELIDALAKEEGSSKDPMLKGQNLFNVYQKRSYTCSVDAFGMMNILPLQYFQLDQVPMFHGAYIITNVEHSVTPGEFHTNFKGTRISRSVVPYVSNFITNTNPTDSTGMGKITYGQGDGTYSVLEGDVDRVGVWMDSKLTKAALNNFVVGAGGNSVGLVLNAHWPNYKKDIGKISPVSGEKVTCATKYMGESWHWQPIHTGTDYSPNSFYSLDELKKECIMLAKKNVFIFIWLYFVPSKSYVEPMCGGTGIESYDPKTDWVDWAAKGASTPPSLPELVKQLNDACKADAEVGKNCIGAVEFDLEAHYTNTKYEGSATLMVDGCYTAWKNQQENVYASYNNVKKKDLAVKVMEKLRQDLPSDCQIGISTIMNSSNKNNKDWGRKIRDNDNDYWKGVVCAEYALQSDYVAAQAYSHPRCEEGANEMCKKCTVDADCTGSNFCQGSTDGVYMGKQPMGKRFYTDKVCQEDTYKWDGWAGTGVTGRPGLYARYVKALQDSTWMGHDATSGKPEFVCGYM